MDKWLIKSQSESRLSTGSQSKSGQFTESRLKSRPSSESHLKSGLSTESQCASGPSTEAQSESLVSSESQPKSGPSVESQPRSRSSIESQPRSGPSTSYMSSLCSETQFESELSTDAQLESEAYSEVETDIEVGHSPRKKVKLQKKVQSRYKFLNDWLKDEKFQGWLSKTNMKNYKGDELAFCQACNLKILSQKSCLIRHRNTSKHMNNWNRLSENVKITDVYKTTPLEENIRRAELKLCGLLACNNLPFLLMDTLGPLCRQIFPDSQIARGLSVKRTKATHLVNEALGKEFLHKLYKRFQDRGCFFSIIMDETTDVSTKKQCAFKVIHFNNEINEVVTNFFDMVEVLSGTANDLYECLKNVISTKNIPFENLIGFSSDTTKVMFGEHNSVYALLKQDNPNICCIKCSCHLIHLAASKACLKLPRSVEDLLRNVGAHFSRSSHRQDKFREFQTFFKTDIHKILLPANTRWLSLKECVDRILEQYEPLNAYLRTLNCEDPSKTTNEMLLTMDNQFCKIYLEFMAYTLGLLTEFNLLFQSNKPLLHRLKSEVCELLKSLCSNYLKFSCIKTGDIMTIDHMNPNNFIALYKLYLGISATESFQKLKKDPDVSKNETDQFLKSCLDFYVTLVTEIKQRFKFKDPLFEFLPILDPKTAQSFELKSLKVVTDRFPVLLDQIDLQELDNEWKKHALLDHGIIDFPPNGEDYWPKVFAMKNACNVCIFPNLKKVISFLLILPFSNASVERVFSDLKNIKTDHRNCLSTESIKSLIATKQGIGANGGCLEFSPEMTMIKNNIWSKKN